MSLRAFHLLFIAASSILSLFLIFWGVYDFKATGSFLGIGLAVGGGISAVLLLVYSKWFLRKYSKLAALAFTLTLFGGTFFSYLPQARACAVCYKDPESPLTKGALAGVAVLAAIISGVLILIAATDYSWHRRAKGIEKIELTSSTSAASSIDLNSP